MITTADFRNGLNIEFEGQPYRIVWFQHHKPGKGGAVMRTKLKNLHTGAIIEQTFKSGEKFKDLVLEKKKKQYLYHNEATYYFMDLESYEQFPLDEKTLGENKKFLKENSEIEVLYLEGEIIGVQLPLTVDLKVVATVPGIRGDTVSNVLKPATLETGTVVQVPLFVNEGDIVKINTETGEYQERV
jgi:elongation factor P